MIASKSEFVFGHTVNGSAERVISGVVDTLTNTLEIIVLVQPFISSISKAISYPPPSEKV